MGNSPCSPPDQPYDQIDEDLAQAAPPQLDDVILTHSSTLLPDPSAASFQALRRALPPRQRRESTWIRLFSSVDDGLSFSLLKKAIMMRGPTLVLFSARRASRHSARRRRRRKRNRRRRPSADDPPPSTDENPTPQSTTGPAKPVLGLFASQSWKEEGEMYGDLSSFAFMIPHGSPPQDLPESETPSPLPVARPSHLSGSHIQYLNSKEHGLCFGGRLGFFSIQIDSDDFEIHLNRTTRTFPNLPDIFTSLLQTSEPIDADTEFIRVDCLECWGFPLSDKDQLDLDYWLQMTGGRRKNVMGDDVAADRFVLASAGAHQTYRDRIEREEGQ